MRDASEAQVGRIRARFDHRSVVEVDAEKIDRARDHCQIAVLDRLFEAETLVFGEHVLGVVALEHRIEEPAVLEAVPGERRFFVLRAVGQRPSRVQVGREPDLGRRGLAGAKRLNGETVREQQVV